MMSVTPAVDAQLAGAFDARYTALGFVTTFLPIAIQVKDNFTQMLSTFDHVKRRLLISWFYSARIATGLLCVLAPEVYNFKGDKMSVFVPVILDTIVACMWPWTIGSKYIVVNVLSMTLFTVISGSTCLMGIIHMSQRPLIYGSPMIVMFALKELMVWYLFIFFFIFKINPKCPKNKIDTPQCDAKHSKRCEHDDTENTTLLDENVNICDAV